MADYLSRHPSPYEGNVVKAEELFNNWFNLNVIDGITPALNKAKRAESAKPIKSQNRNKESNTQVLTVHASVHTLTQSKQVDQLQNIEKMADLANSKISKVYVQAKYESDKTIQKVIRLVKDRNVAVISRLPPPWRKKFNSFSVDEKSLLFMDQRLVIPKDMRENLLCAIHFGHAGRDAMLKEAADVWWPRIHREIIEKARKCPECLKAGKNLKCNKSQSEFGKLPETNEPNEEISVDFAGPFQNAIKQKKYLLVSVDNHSGWPNALFLPSPPTDKVIEFLTEYIATNGIPKRIRTDPCTAFKSEKFKQFCEKYFIKHMTCPIRDHKGDWKGRTNDTHYQ